MKKNSFIEGAFVATLAIIISKLLGLIYVIPFYQIIGEKGGALYGYAYNVYNLFLTIATVGLPLAISKLISEYEALGLYKSKHKVFHLSSKVIWLFSIVCFLIILIFAPFIAKLIIGDVTGGNTVHDISLVLRVVAIALLIIPYLSITRGYLQGHKFITVSSISQVIEQIVRITFLLLGSYLSMKVFNLNLNTTVGVAILGATVGGLVALIYLTKKLFIFKNSKEELAKINPDEKVIEDKVIIKKIISYALPFIIVNVANSIYNFTDMVLIIRTLDHLGFSANDIETISSIFTTWGSKLFLVITSIATGMIISIIPNIANNYVKNNINEINYKLNKSIQIVFLFIMPMTFAFSFLAKPIWIIFYSNSIYGPLVFKYYIIMAIFISLFVIINSFLQSLSRYKLLFRTVIGSIIINIILDVPLMLLFNYLNMPPYYGAITSTIIAVTISILYSLINLKREFNFKYKEAFKFIPKIILTVIIMKIVTLIANNYIQLPETRIMQLYIFIINAFIYLIIYYLINQKEIKLILGDKFIRKFLNKFKKKNQA